MAASGSGAFLDGAEGAEVDGIGSGEEGCEGGFLLFVSSSSIGLLMQDGFEFGQEEDASTFSSVPETAERDIIFVGDGAALSDDASATVYMAAGGIVGVVGLRETYRTLGDWRSASIDPKPREAVLEELASKRHCIR